MEIKWLDDFTKSWQDRVAHGRVPHAVLLAGPPGVGKRAAARWMAASTLGLEVSACSVFRHYGELLDGFIIDQVDAKLASALDQPGRDVFVTDTVMTCKEDKMRLAQFVLDNVQALTQ